MDEAQVKAAVLMQVRKAHVRGLKPIVTAEFSLGSSGVRADLAVFGDVNVGIEIKTARDTLRRLPAQMAAYLRYFDQAAVVVAESHVPNLSDDYLCGASVWTYDAQGVLTVLREGAIRSVDDEVLKDVLTKTERRKGDFRAAIEARYGETSRQFWQAVGRRTIKSEDLSLLSRFAAGRELARQWAAERETRWSQWLAAQEGLPGVST